MKKTVIKNFYMILFFSLLVMLDRVTKNLAIVYLKDNEPFEIVKNVFEFNYLDGGNSGAAWGILEGQTAFFLLVTIVVLIFIVVLLIRINRLINYIYTKKIEVMYSSCRKFLLLQLIFVLLAAGAVGNLIDRILYGYVIDFIYFKLINFPIFNVADCYVTAAVALIIISSLFILKSDEFDIVFSAKPVPELFKKIKIDNNINTNFHDDNSENKIKFDSYKDENENNNITI